MLEIKFVEKEDIKTLAALAKEIWFEYWKSILSQGQIEFMVEKFQSENAMINQIENENYSYYFLETEGENIGYFGISDKKDHLFLSKFYIKKDFRHRKFGTIAFEAIKHLAREKNLSKIQLTVNKHNINTIKAYEKWGFKNIYPLVTDIGNGYVMDDFVMEYTL